jgi:hypothetical protein
MDQKLQQQIRTDRAPDERERELQHLRHRAKPRVVLEAGAWEPGAFERVVENDAVVLRDDERVFA